MAETWNLTYYGKIFGNKNTKKKEKIMKYWVRIVDLTMLIISCLFVSYDDIDSNGIIHKFFINFLFIFCGKRIERNLRIFVSTWFVQNGVLRLVVIRNHIKHNNDEKRTKRKKRQVKMVRRYLDKCRTVFVICCTKALHFCDGEKYVYSLFVFEILIFFPFLSLSIYLSREEQYVWIDEKWNLFAGAIWATFW